MPSQPSIGVLQAKRDARLKQLAAVGPLLQGSLVQMRVTCGSPTCRCARGEKHVAFQVTKKVRGTTKSLYIPLALVDEVRGWLQEYRRVKRLLQEISALNELLVKAHGLRQRARRAAAQAAAARPRRKSPPACPSP